MDIATVWGIEEEDDYAASAFELYRNYDGEGGTYGNTDVRASTNDRKNISAYAAIEDEDPSTLHIILLNKNRDGAIEVQFGVESSVAYSSAEFWTFDEENASVTEEEALEDEVDLTENTFAVVFPRMTAAHLVVRSAD